MRTGKEKPCQRPSGATRKRRLTFCLRQPVAAENHLSAPPRDFAVLLPSYA
jgi:hypothetical protein